MRWKTIEAKKFKEDNMDLFQEVKHLRHVNEQLKKKYQNI
jgi:FtsZ-binding cell division protein ZapB